MLKIDKLAYENNLFRIRTSLKVGMSMLLLMLSIIIDNNFIKIIIILINISICIFFAKIPYLEYFKLYRIPLAFLILGLLTMILSIGKNNNNFLFSLNIFNFYFGVSENVLAKGVDTFIRSISAISSTYTLILTTPINQLINFLKTIKFPNIITEQLLLIYRFINIFLEELEKMKIAMELKQGYGSKKNWIKSLSLIGSSLFIKIMNSFKDYSLTLELKHFNGDFY